MERQESTFANTLLLYCLLPYGISLMYCRIFGELPEPDNQRGVQDLEEERALFVRHGHYPRAGVAIFDCAVASHERVPSGFRLLCP